MLMCSKATGIIAINAINVRYVSAISELNEVLSSDREHRSSGDQGCILIQTPYVLFL